MTDRTKRDWSYRSTGFTWVVPLASELVLDQEIRDRMGW